MAMVLQQTSTFFDGRKPRKMYAVIRRDISGKYAIYEWTDEKDSATDAYRTELLEWMRAMVERLNQCPRLENGEAGRFYALRYRRPSGMKRVSCCRCGKRFYAYIDCYNPQYENRVCSKCAIQKGETNA